jgi:hypothetical protein
MNKLTIILLTAGIVALNVVACVEPSNLSTGNLGQGNRRQTCACNPKQHYMPCNCKAKETDCDCTVIPLGYIKDAAYPDLNVPIYQKSVDIGDTNTAKNNIIAGYNQLDITYKAALASANNFKEVWILSGRGYSFDSEAGIVKIGAYWCGDKYINDISDIFIYFVIPLLF